MEDVKYLEGKLLSQYVSVDAPKAYSAAMLDVLRGDTKKKIKVNAPHTNKGFYYRTQEVSDKPKAQTKPTKQGLGQSVDKPKSNKGAVIGAAIAGLAIGAAVGGGIGFWQSNEKTKQAVTTVQKSAEQRLGKEIDKVKEELVNKYESELSSVTEQSKKDVELATAKAKEESATQFTKQIEEIQSRYSAVQSELQGELDKTRSELSEKQQTEAVLKTQLEATQQRATETEGVLRNQLERTTEEANQERQAKEQATAELESLRQAQARITTELEAAQKLAEERISAITKESELKIKEGITAGVIAEREELSRQKQELQATTKSLESTYQTRFKELDLSHAERMAELERTHRDRTIDLERTSRAELERRTREIEERINTEALKQIEESRVKAIDEARSLVEKQIQEVEDKKLAGSTNPGKLISTEETGVAIAASVRRGLPIETIPRDSMAGRINDAIDKLTSIRTSRALTDLAADFRNRAQEIRQMKTRVAKNRWEAMEHALIQQTNRENGVIGAIGDIKTKYKEEHQKALSSFYDKVDGRGNYDADLVEQFDKKLTKLNKAMQKEINSAIEETKQNIGLDKPFTGRPADRSDAWKTVNVKGTAERKAYTRRIKVAAKQAQRSVRNEVRKVVTTGQGTERDIKPALENIVTIGASVAAPSWMKPVATAGTRIAMRAWRLSYDDVQRNGLPGLAEGISKMTPEQKEKMFKDGAVQASSSFAGVTLSKFAPEVELQDFNVGGTGAGIAGGAAVARIAKKILKTDAYTQGLMELIDV